MTAIEPKKEKNITDSVMIRVNQVKEVGGLHIPSDYSPENALKSAWFSLQTVKDRNQKLAMDVCTKDSISNTLFEMVTSGLNPMKKQCYFVVFGKELTLMTSYQGKIALAKRYSGVKSVIAREIYKKDKFVTKIEPDGREILITHEQSFENTDSEIIGGYCIIVDKDGLEYLTKMSKKKIETSWKMGAAKGKGKFHEDFTDEAVKKTLIQRACKPYINSSDDENVIDNSEVEKKELTIDTDVEVIDENKDSEVKSEIVVKENSKSKTKVVKNNKPVETEEKEGCGF